MNNLMQFIIPLQVIINFSELVVKRNILDKQISDLQLKLRKDNNIMDDLKEIISETKASYDNISEAANTLMDIIDQKYNI